MHLVWVFITGTIPEPGVLCSIMRVPGWSYAAPDSVYKFQDECRTTINTFNVNGMHLQHVINKLDFDHRFAMVKMIARLTVIESSSSGAGLKKMSKLFWHVMKHKIFVLHTNMKQPSSFHLIVEITSSPACSMTISFMMTSAPYSASSEGEFLCSAPICSCPSL